MVRALLSTLGRRVVRSCHSQWKNELAQRFHVQKLNGQYNRRPYGILLLGSAVNLKHISRNSGGSFESLSSAMGVTCVGVTFASAMVVTLVEVSAIADATSFPRSPSLTDSDGPRGLTFGARA